MGRQEMGASEIMGSIPPPPPGFIREGEIPPPPKGFVMAESQSAQPTNRGPQPGWLETFPISRGLDAINQGLEAAGEYVGEPVRKATEPLGPNVSAALGTAANIGTQFAIPSMVTGGANLALKGARAIAPKLPGAGTALRETGID